MSSLPSKILIDNTESTDCKFIANAFNDFFANIGQKLASSVTPANVSPMKFMPPSQEDSIYLYIKSNHKIGDWRGNKSLKLY